MKAIMQLKTIIIIYQRKYVTITNYETDFNKDPSQINDNTESTAQAGIP
jgi:hypothetical protein